MLQIEDAGWVCGCKFSENHPTFVFLPETLVFFISDGLPVAFSFSSSASSRNSGASRASTAASSLMSCRQMCGRCVWRRYFMIPYISCHWSCDVTYVSVGEQSFNHRMVMSWDSFCFQDQVETDVGAVTTSGNNNGHYLARKQQHKQATTIKVQLTWDKVAVLSWGSRHPLKTRTKSI